jgi:hypothetical protein
VPVLAQDVLGNQLQLPQATDFGHQHEEVQATGRVLGDDVLDLVDGTVVDGLLGRHRQDRVVALVVGDRLSQLALPADGDVGDRVEAEVGLAALSYLRAQAGDRRSDRGGSGGATEDEPVGELDGPLPSPAR